MNPDELDLLYQLRERPGDWPLRLDLAAAMAERGAGDEAGKLLGEAAVPPGDEAQLVRALALAGGNPSGGNWRHFLQDYLAGHPGSVPAMTALVGALYAEGFPAEAREWEGRLRELEALAPRPVNGMAETVEEGAEETEAPLPSAESGKVQAAEPGDDRRERIAALGIALGIHLLLAILLALWAVSEPRQGPPSIVASAPPGEIPDDKPAPPKRTPTPERSAAASAEAMAVTPVPVSSAVSVPSFDLPATEPNQMGAGQNFGPSMSFGGGGKGMVSFFGSRAKASKVVFVVDVSYSMAVKGERGKTRFALMKEELTRSVEALPKSTRYQIVFFSGPSWFAGEPVDEDSWTSRQGPNSWFYKGARLPSAPLRPASPSRIRESLSHIEEVDMMLGTDWRSPLKMAMNLNPDVIFFMTDGEVREDPGQKPLVEDLLDYNRSRSGAVIHCICMMAPEAYEMMSELARETKGEFSLVQEDGEVLRGREAEKASRE